MSIALMSQIWKHSKFSGGELLVLLALADHANDEGYCWPAINSIATKSRLKRRRTIDVINTLVESGAIVRTHRIDNKGDPTSNMYRVLYPMSTDRGSAVQCTTPSAPQDTTPSAVECTGVVQYSAPKSSFNHKNNRNVEQETTPIFQEFIQTFVEHTQIPESQIQRKEAQAAIAQMTIAGATPEDMANAIDALLEKGGYMITGLNSVVKSAVVEVSKRKQKKPIPKSQEKEIYYEYYGEPMAKPIPKKLDSDDPYKFYEHCGEPMESQKAQP